MIERKIVAHKLKEFQIREYISQEFRNSGISDIMLKKTPLGDKVVISTSRPGLIVGRKGKNIKQLTITLKNKFGLESLELEINEVKDVFLDSTIVGNTIAASLERYGIQRFKGIVHAAMTKVIGAGAKGVEIVVSGKVPSSRARSWRFYQGYLKKSGDVAESEVDISYSRAELKTGTVGVKVSIMPADAFLPDAIEYIYEETELSGSDKEKVEKEIESSAKKASKEKPLPEEEIKTEEEKVEKKGSKGSSKTKAKDDKKSDSKSKKSSTKAKPKEKTIKKKSEEKDEKKEKEEKKDTVEETDVKESNDKPDETVKDE